MLEKIREGAANGIAFKILLVLIMLTFMLTGISGYITGAADTSIAEVNGESISKLSYQQAYRAQRSQMEQQYGDMFQQLANNPAYMKTFREGVLSNLINEELLKQLSTDLGMAISDEEVRKAIRQQPEFQIDGVFNQARFDDLLLRQGFTQTAYVDYVREQMARNQLVIALRNSEFALRQEAEDFYAIDRQTRDVNFATVKQANFQDDIEVTETELEESYQANIQNYQQSEQVRLDYIELSVTELMDKVTVTAEAIEQYYQENQQKYTEEEQRRVSHILIELGEDQAAAKAKIDAIKARIDAGEDFAEVAKTESQDTFSGESGGDLEWIKQDGTMAKAFEDAAFALSNAGDVSDIVETEFGFHIIKLTDIKAKQITALNDVKPEIEDAIRREEAAVLFEEKQAILQDRSFEIEDSLTEVAQEAGVELKTSPLFERTSAPAPFAEPNVAEAIFSDIVLEERRNSELLPISGDRVIVLRINEYKPSRTKTLDEVKAQVEAVVKREKASDKAREIADALLATAESAGTLNADSESQAEFKSMTAVLRSNRDIDMQLAEYIFAMPQPSETKSSFGQVKLNNGDYVVVQLTKVESGKIDAADTVTAQRIESRLSAEQYQLFLKALAENADVTRKRIADDENQLPF